MTHGLPAGYKKYDYADPFENHVGLLGYKVDDGKIRFAFHAQPHHCNTQATLHGGMLMTFADFALCLVAIWDQPDEKCVTVSFNCEFSAAGKLADRVESVGEVVRRTGSLVFVRGQIYSGEETLVNYSGIVKRVRHL